MKQMIVNVMPEESRMALLVDGKLNDYAMEREGMEHVVNRIYKASVRNVLPGMQAAFVDIGREQNAYLNLRQGKQNKMIGPLTEGQSLLVQVVKEEIGKKSAKVTADISLAGKYMVLLPYSTGVHISKKVSDKEQRERLIQLATPFLENGGGLILRTAAVHAEPLELTNEMMYLCQTWEQIQKRFQIAKGGTELYRDADFALRLVRDYLPSVVDEIIVDDEVLYKRFVELLQHSALKEKVSLYKGVEPLFRAYHVESELESLLQSEISLPSGGSICIDKTEALTVIDVNSGQYTGRSNDAGDLALRVNQEAAVEICRQLRLRDVGGIIIVDFIDMNKESQREMLYQVLYKEIKKDRSKVVICGLTSLGLLEMTRKRERLGIADFMFDTCSCCGGTGYLLSPYTVYLQILRKLRELSGSKRVKGDLLIEVHKDVARYFTKEILKQLSLELSHAIQLEISESTNRESYSILSLN